MAENKFSDPTSERAILSIIVKGGKDAYVDSTEYLDESDFSLPINRIIYKCLGELTEDDSIKKFDAETIRFKARALGMGDAFKNKVEKDYLEFLEESSFPKNNLKPFAIQVRKLSILKQLKSNYTGAIEFIDSLKGGESLSEIMGHTETLITQTECDIDGSSKIELITDDIDQYLHDLLNKEPVEQLGINSGFPIWDKSIGGGMRRASVNMIAARPKCINSENTILLSNMGMLYPSELHDTRSGSEETNIEYKLINENGKLEKPSLWLNSYLTKNLKIRTKHGYEIESTLKHPIRVVDSNGEIIWKKAKDITKEDWIVIRKGDCQFGANKIDDLDAYIYGCLCGDGYVGKNVKRISLTSMDKEIVNAYYKFASKYNFKVTKKTKLNNKASSYDLINNSVERNKIIDLGFYFNKNKHIPTFIRKSCERSICQFLKGLFDTDGCVEKKSVTLCTKSSRLANQVRCILLNIGIVSNTRIRKIFLDNRKIYRNYYYISIGSSKNINLFKEKIGFGLRRKQDLLIKLCQQKSSEKYDIIPNISNWMQKIKIYILKNNILLKNVVNFDTINRWIRKDRKADRSTVLKYIFNIIDKTSINPTEILQLLNDNYIYDQVKSIKKSQSYTCDYHLPETHSFVSNGFISHNTGKSFHAMNVAVNISKQKIPVLYLDTELVKQFQQARLLGMIGEIPINLIETRKIQKYPQLIKQSLEAQQIFKDLPLYYKNISGMNIAETLQYMRRWIVKAVGFREDGKANDCMIVYDYLKLTSGEGLSHHSPEYLLIGLMMTQLHNFAVKYDIPVLSYIQVNRHGIDNNDTGIIAQSDRVLWLATSVSVLRNKEHEDLEMGSKWEHGNKKLSVLENRFGAGLAHEADYINLHASLRPNVTEEEACGLITEGLKHSDVFSGFLDPDDSNKPNNGTQGNSE